MVCSGPEQFIAVGDLVARKGCHLGLTVKRRELRDLTVIDKKKAVLFVEQIIGGDVGSAAMRLLGKLKRKGWA